MSDQITTGPRATTNDCAVIFDMDGVIIHSNPLHAEAFRAFFRRYELAFAEEDLAAHMYGKHNSYILKHFFGREITGEEFLSMEAEKEALFREIVQDRVEPVPGLIDFMGELMHHGISMGVATSAPRANLDLIIDTLALRSQLKSILTSEDVIRHKPDPEIYLRSAEALGVAPSRCVVFEDSFSGVTAGKEAGMIVVGVLTSHRKDELPVCDQYIDDFRGLTAQSITTLVDSRQHPTDDHIEREGREEQKHSRA